jgi:tetratricopeptide (TPR) repeat protein
MIFLEQVAKARGQIRFPPENAIAVVLRLAECQQKVNQPEQAEKSYELARRIAAQTGQKKLESLASVSEAPLEVQQKKTGQALRLYQSALRLDRDGDDPQSEAADWYSYGVFLRDSGFPPRLAYACLVQSEALSLHHSLQNTPQREGAASVRKEKELESKIASDSSVRRDPQPALEEALRLTFP